MKNMYCELYQRECPWTRDDEREPYCTREAECPFEEDLPYDDDDFEAELTLRDCGIEFNPTE